MKKFFKVAFLSLIGIFFLLIVVVIYLFVSGDDEVSTGTDSDSKSTEEAEAKETENENEPKEEYSFEEVKNMTEEERENLSQAEKSLYGISPEGKFYSEHTSSKEQIEGNNKETETESENMGEDSEEEINDATTDFDGLPLPIKVHLVASTVDERAHAQDLTGFTLYYNIVGDNLFLVVHSGAGTGHPIFKIQMDSDTITPIDGVMSVGPEIEEVEVNSSSISKKDLYNNYTKHKDIYDSGQSNVKQDADITTGGYEGKKSLLQ